MWSRIRYHRLYASHDAASPVTVLALLLALVIAHFARGFRHLRRYRGPVLVLDRLQRTCHRHWPQQGWLAGVAAVVVIVLVGALVQWLFHALLGNFGSLLLGIAVLLYCLGPRDLDTEVDRLAESDDPAERAEIEVDLGPGGPAERVMRAALERWFGVIFWFVLLGVPGALLYRLCARLVRHDGSAALQIERRRTLAVLDWPAAQLMTLSLALTADFEKVLAAWRDWHAEHGWGPGAGMLTAGAAALSLGEAECENENPHQLAMRWVWRMLALWLVALSALMIAGWLI